MIKKYLIILILTTSYHAFSQEVYVNVGKNFTRFNYKNSEGQANSNLFSGIGNFYEVGVAIPFTNEHFIYSANLSLNEYDATGGNSATTYRWNTQYLGIKGGIEYSFFPYSYNASGDLDFTVDAGLIGQSIIFGKQEINGSYYDLVRNKEFSGIVLGSSIGGQVKYAIASFGFISVGYNYCYNVNISNSSQEKLSFSTHQIGLGFHLPIN
jgi:hypothetical protein